MSSQEEQDKFYEDLRHIVHNCLNGEVRKAVHVILSSDKAAPRVLMFSVDPSKHPNHPDLLDLEIGLKKVASYLRPHADNPYDPVSSVVYNRANFYLGMIKDMLENKKGG